MLYDGFIGFNDNKRHAYASVDSFILGLFVIRVTQD